MSLQLQLHAFKVGLPVAHAVHDNRLPTLFVSSGANVKKILQDFAERVETVSPMQPLPDVGRQLREKGVDVLKKRLQVD